MKKNLIVGQSGGPTAVINSSLYGVVSEAYAQENVDNVLGMVNGIQGFLDGKVFDFQAMRDDGSLEKLQYTPASFLGSCRYKLPESLEDPVYPEIFRRLDEMNVGYFCYNGGNDSMDTVSKLSRYAAAHGSEIRFMGVPKTVDNDLVHTDHTPGFGSAARYVAQTLREIIYDSQVYDQKTVAIVEIMGRHAGWLTAASVLAREPGMKNPCLIYLPEVDFDTKKFMSDVESAFDEQNNLIICVSEGIKDATGKLICEYDADDVAVDSFGHKMLSGCSDYLAKLIKARFKAKVRSIELSLCQRCSSSLISKTDQQEAVMAGREAAKAAAEGKTGLMVAFDRAEGSEYKITCSLKDVNEICNAEKTVPLEWITKDGTDISDEFIAYAKPLIQGQVVPPIGEDGLIDFVKR